jgi:predicted negative regulator of RcsB-dependent stress response
MDSKASTSGDDALENAIDWMRLNTKAIGIAALVIAAAAAGWFFYKDNEVSKETSAGKAYFDAQRSVAAGNLPLAQADLEKMLPRYHGTTSGTLAAILLAQVHYQGGKFAEGVKVLEDAQLSAPDQLKAAVSAMIGSGMMDQKKYADAAKAYLKAAELAPEGSEREGFQVEAARAFQLANNPAEAIKLYKAITENPESAHGAEARVRLGELEAAAAK